ncbi:MAG: zinc ribbon domain-containing protein [Candidatus Woesearchaeota archaeon]
MPIYTYLCTNSKCGEKYEILVLKKEDEPSSCKKCGSKLEKIISKTNFKLNGSGWYRDGYSKK